MAVWVALLRGVNLGGHNKVPMAELRAGLSEAGLSDVATHIASGNVVFRTDGDVTADRAGLADLVSGVIADRFDLEIPVVVRTADQLRAVAASNPFPEADDDPKSVHCYFTTVPVDDGALGDFDADRHEPDRLAVAAGELFAHYPNGMGRSKLTSNVIDRVAGGPTTARNWNTVRKLVTMVDEAEATEARLDGANGDGVGPGNRTEGER